MSQYTTKVLIDFYNEYGLIFLLIWTVNYGLPLNLLSKNLNLSLPFLLLSLAFFFFVQRLFRVVTLYFTDNHYFMTFI